MAGQIALRDKEGERFTCAPVELEKAAAKVGLLTVEQHSIVIECLHVEYVVRVYRVKTVMDAHPADRHPHPGIPMAVEDALRDLRAIEEFMKEIRIERLPPESIHERIAAMEKAS